MITLDFDKVSNLKKEYKKQLYWYKHLLHFVLSYKKALTIDILNNQINDKLRKKDLLKLYRSYLKDTTNNLIKLKKQIKEAERDFEDDVKLFYLDFENHYGQPFKYRTCNFPHNSLKNQMKYFYYTVKQINKQ